MQTDTIERDGKLAAKSGYGTGDCPYRDCTEKVPAVTYWESEAGQRQRWMRGFLMEALNHEVDLQR